MSKTSTINRKRTRKGYLIPIPIEESEIEGEGYTGQREGPISRRFKLVRIRDWDFSKKRYCYSSEYFKKIRVLTCSYCGQEARFSAIFHYSGHDMIERLCQKCVKVYGPIPIEGEAVCNLL